MQQQVLGRQNAKWREFIVEIVANQRFSQDVVCRSSVASEVWVLSLRLWGPDPRERTEIDQHESILNRLV